MPIGGSAGQRAWYVLIEQCVDPEAQFKQWTPLDYVWMSRDDVSADERFQSDQETAYADSKWFIPYRADMDPESVDVPAVRRFAYEGRTYDIRSARPDGWKRYIEVVTLSRVG